MTNSYRKTPILPIASQTGARDYKRLLASQRRAFVRDKIKTAIKYSKFDDLDVAYDILPFDEWSTSRDGKTYYTDRDITYVNSYRMRLGKPILPKRAILGK